MAAISEKSFCTRKAVESCIAQDASGRKSLEAYGRREIIWPEWSDADVNSEKWDLPKVTDKGKGKPTDKSTSGATSLLSTTLDSLLFEDPYSVPLPGSLKNVSSWIRPSSLNPSAKAVIYSTGGTMYPDVLSTNRHLLHSEFVKSVLTSVYILTYLGYTHPFIVEWETALYGPNTSGSPWKPWHHIYSACKAGRNVNHLPIANALGKYVVRLYYMGCWRKITVDDRYPVDETGRSLLPTTKSESDKELELWPLILTKALLKIASLTWTPTQEIVDFDIITCLTGWPGQKIKTTDMEVFDVWDMCIGYTDHYAWEPEVVSKAPSKKGGSEKSSAKSDKSGKSGKNASAKNAILFHLVGSCKDLRDLEENAIPDISPCVEHTFLIEQTRVIPLLRPDPNKVLPLWKRHRWYDWAIERGLWDIEDWSNFRFIKFISNLRKATQNVTYDKEPTDEAVQIQKSVQAIDDKVKSKGKKDDGSKKSDKSSKASKGGKKQAEFVDPSIWNDFNKLGPYVNSITIYFKPSQFKISYMMTNLSISMISGIKKDAKKPDKKGGQEENVIKYLSWKNELQESRNEPLYMFIDSIDFKLIVLNLAHVGNDFPLPEKKPEPLEELKLCKKLVCKLGKCIGECKCQGESKEDIPGAKKDIDTRTTAHFVVEDYDWKSIEIGKMITFLNTLGQKTTLMEVEKGRFVMRLWMHSDDPYVLTVLSDSNLKIGKIDEILEFMTAESEMLTKSCYDVCSAFGNLVRDYGTPEYINSLKNFYKSYTPNVNLSKNQMAGVHDSFLEEFLNVLRNINPEDQYYNISRALRVLFLNPNIRILGKKKVYKQYQEPPPEVECECEDIDGMKLRDCAAVKIQSWFKMIYMKRLQKLHAQTHKSFIQILETLKKIYTTTLSAKVRIPLVVDMLRNIVTNKLTSTTNQYLPFYRSLNSAITVKQFTGELRLMEPNTWVPITRQIFSVNSDIPIYIRAYLFCALPEYVVRIFDNDTGREITRYTNNALVSQYVKNEKGYTIFGYGWTHYAPVDSLTWKLNMITTKTPDTQAIQVTSAIIDKILVRGDYIPNLNNLIFRCSVKIQQNCPVSLRLSLSSEHVQVNLQCITRYGDILGQITGMNNIILPIILLEMNPVYHRPASPSETLKRDTKDEGKKSVKKGSSLIRRKSTVDKLSIDKRNVSSFSLKKKPRPSSVSDNSTEVFIQAFVLNNSWPLTKAEWDRVEVWRTRGYIEHEIFGSKSSSLTSSPRRMKSGSKRSLDKSIRKSREKGSSLSRIPGSENPFWVLTVVNDINKPITVELDNRRLEEIKDIKRICFESDPNRLMRGKELRNEFLERSYVKWSTHSQESIKEIPGSGSEIINLDGNFFSSTLDVTRRSTLRSDSIAFSKSKSRVISVEVIDDDKTMCPVCNKPVTVENILLLKPPKSLDKMLPIFNVNKFDETTDFYRWAITPEDEDNIFITMNKALQDFDELQDLYLYYMEMYYEYGRNKYRFLSKWYDRIRGDSFDMMRANELKRENYIKELQAEKLAAELAAGGGKGAAKGKGKK